jgi:acylpyruvate hydrolase
VKLAQIATNEGVRVGVLINDRVLTISALAAVEYDKRGPVWPKENAEMLDIIKRGDQALADITHLIELHSGIFEKDDRLGNPVESVSFLPPVYPSKIVAIGRNYVDHAIEGGAEPPAAPLIFNKLPNSVSSHNAPIVLHKISAQVDYEAELAVVIGRRASRVPESEALKYVFGYTPINDVSARDLQFGDGQWVRGKSLDTFAPFGPFITTRDEIPNVQDLKIEGRIEWRGHAVIEHGQDDLWGCLSSVLHLSSYYARAWRCNCDGNPGRRRYLQKASGAVETGGCIRGSN